MIFSQSTHKIILLVLLTSFFCLVAFGQKAPTKKSFEIALDESVRTHIINNMNINQETGFPIAIYNVNYSVQQDTPEEMARQYLMANVPLLGLAYPNLSDLQHHATRTSDAGHTVRFRQHHQGLPVNKAELTVSINKNNVVTFLMSSYVQHVRVNDITPSFAKSVATQMAKDHIRMSGNLKLEDTKLMVYSNKGKSRLAYKAIIMADEPIGEWQVFINAKTQEIFKAVDAALYCSEESHGHKHEKTNTPVNGTGNIFDPDPLSSATTTYGTGGYTDNNDLDSPDLNSQLMNVTLLDIDLTGGVYTLKGPYAEIVDMGAPNTGLFTQNTSTFNYNRGDDEFEAVNTYYHIDYSMRYINTTLNCPLAPYQYNGGVKFDPQGVNGSDNSFYSSGSGALEFGEGCVDDAEDSDVIHHELGHGIHDWITNGNLSQVDGLSEGCGDYWAQSYNRGKGYWNSTDPQYNWVFNWDGHNVCWSGRITNYTASYPGGLVGQIHTDGQIWSTCMMQVWDAIGHQQTDKIFLLGLGMTNGTASQNDAANAVYQAAIDLSYPNADLLNIHTLLTGCGYTLPPPPNAPPIVDFEADETTICLDDGGGVNFTDLSIGIPSSWSWSFPGATPSTSTMQNPSVTYTATGTYNVTLTATNANGSDSQTYNTYITVVSGANCPSCVTYTSTDIPITMSPTGAGPYTSTITVASAGTITDINVVNINGTHSYIEDLVFTLISPAGTSINLVGGVCGSANDFDLGFDDAATGTIPCPPVGGGIYPPANLLSAFNNEDPQGVWILSIADTYSGADGGSLDGWAIEICQVLNATCNLNLSTTVMNSDCGFATGTATVTPGAGNTPYTYQWDAGASNQNTQTAINLLPGTYTVSVSDSNGCLQLSNAIITGPANVISASASENASASCNGSSDGALTALGNGGVTPYTYAWDFGASMQSPFFVSAGTYTVSITDNNGCIATASATVNEPSAIASMSTTTPENCSSKDGTATVNPSGGTPGYQYLWDIAAGGQMTQTATGLATGPYNVTITDASGCFSVETITVPGTAGPTLASSATIATCGMTNGTAIVNPTGGTAPYTFQWDAAAANQTTQTAINLGSGMYLVVVTDMNGCAEQIVVTVADDCSGCAITSSTSGVDENCAGNCDGMATVLPSNGTAPFTYLWSDFQITQTAVNLCPGTYFVTVLDAQLCTSIATYIVNGPNAIASTTNSTNTTCAGNDGAAMVNSMGGTAPYTYQWDAATGNQSAQTATALAVGSYSATITDMNGCTETVMVNVVDGCACSLSSTSSNTGATCAGNDGTATIIPMGGMAPYTYQWDATAANQTTQTAINLAPGTYTVQYTDVTGCANSATVVVADACNCSISVSVSSTSATCGAASGTATANPVGGMAPISYLWSNGETTQSISGLLPGQFDLTVTDANGCPNAGSVIVNDSGSLNAVITSNNLACNGDLSGFISVDNSTTLNYIWSNGANTSIISNLPAGTYSVTVSQGSCIDVETIVLTEPVAINSTMITNDSQCSMNGASANAAVSGGNPPYQYLWNTGATMPGIGGLSTGTYTCTITDAIGCTSVITGNLVSVANGPVLSSTHTDVSCAGDSDGAIDLSVNNGTAPFTYTWSNGVPIEDQIGLPAGAYTVNVTDTNGCIGVTTVQISEPAAMDLTFTVTPTTGSNNGSAGVNVSGGVPGYTFQWDNGQTGPIATGLAPGLYTVIVTDSNGCITQESVFVGVYNGIIDLENLNNFELRPNPSNGVFIIDLEFLSIEKASIQIYNVLGQGMYRQELYGTSFSIPMNLSSYGGGTYFAIVRTAKGEAVKRFVLVD